MNKIKGSKCDKCGEVIVGIFRGKNSTLSHSVFQVNTHDKATPSQIRMAQDIASEFKHLNTGIESLWDLYKSAPALLEACKDTLTLLQEIKAPEVDQRVFNILKRAITKAEGKS